MLGDRASAYYATYQAKSLDDALANEFSNGKSVLAAETLQGAVHFAQGALRGGKHTTSKL